MGAATLFGSLLALVVIVGSLFGFSFPLSVVVFVGAVYVAWLVLLVIDVSTRPDETTSGVQRLTRDESRVMNSYHLTLAAPGAGELLSCFLNALRFAGILWGAFCIGKGLYWIAALAMAYWFVSAGVIVRFNPRPYLAASAKNGNPTANDELAILTRLENELGR